MSRFTVFSHLSSPKVEDYRRILEAFARARQEFIIHLRPFDIARTTGFPEADLDAMLAEGQGTPQRLQRRASSTGEERERQETRRKDVGRVSHAAGCRLRVASRSTKWLQFGCDRRRFRLGNELCSGAIG